MVRPAEHNTDMATRQCLRFSPEQNDFLREWLGDLEGLGEHPDERDMEAFHKQLWQSYTTHFWIPARFERLTRFVRESLSFY